MATAKTYEDLVAWQLCTELCEIVFRLTDSGKCLTDAEFRRQIRDAAQNAPALIAEGFVRYTPGEFVRYLRMARGELGEVRSRLTHARSRSYFTEQDWQQVWSLSERAIKTTTALLRSKLPHVKKGKGGSPVRCQY